VQYVHLGRTGLLVSRLCLGTMNFGGRASETDSFAMMDHAREKGINFLDSANLYGGEVHRGLTEEVIGRWFAQGGGRRDSTVLTTKVFGIMGDGPNDRGLSAYHIRKACDDSLRRLQTDHIDVYFMHHVDRGLPTKLGAQMFNYPDRDVFRPTHRKDETPWEEIWQAMELLVQQGKVLYVACSNFAGWHIAQGCERAAARSFLGPIAEQSLYNLTQRSIELEVVPACRDYGLGIMPWSPLAGGLLAGASGKVADGRRAALDERFAACASQLSQYETLCREIGHSPADVALAWLLHNPVVASPIIGPRTMQQLADCLGVVNIRLDDATLTKLDEIWPGPGDQAPEAYAW
jgi:NDP-hexose C3-ketoreductase / dTDP-4-oxo-2-deoxy-alpha-D-pentos-2-ene 2,3-reductase